MINHGKKNLDNRLVVALRKLILMLLTILCVNRLTAQPIITALTPSSGGVGTSVTINGSNFSPVPSNNVVYIGAVKATVTAATPTALTVTVPLRATHGYVTVSTSNLTAYSLQPFTVVSGGALTPLSFVMRWGLGLTGAYPSSLAVGDLDGDGKPELVTTNFNSNNISIVKNSSVPGVVGITSESKLATGILPEGLALGDLNADGKLDIVITSITDHLLSIFLNTSSGSNISFASRIDFSAGTFGAPRGVAISDLDGDGKPDLAVADNNKVYSNGTSYGTVSIYRNTMQSGTVSFAPPLVLPTGEYPRKVSIGDLDGDGKADVAVTNHISGSVTLYQNHSVRGTLSFSGRQDYATGANTEEVALGDFNGDNKPDMAVTNLTPSTVSLFMNVSANGTISFAPKQDVTVPSPLGVAIADLNGDGKPDMAVTSFTSGKIAVFQNTSTSNALSFAAKLDYNCGGGPVDLCLGDIDGDGYPDISLTNAPTNFVSVIKMEAGPLSVNLGPDLTLCEGDSAVLTASVPFVQYEWSTGATQNNITVKNGGTYWVKVTNGTSTAFDTVRVTFHPRPTFDLGGDTTICEGQTVVFRPGVTGATYLWQNGSMADSLLVSGPGTYLVELQRNGCKAADTVRVNYLLKPPLNLGADRALCPGDHILVDASDASIQNYTWQDNSTGPNFSVSTPGTYWVRAKGINGCFNSDTLKVWASPLASVSLGNDTTLCNHHTLFYNLPLLGATYLWSNGSTSNSFSTAQSGLVWVELSQDGCTKRDSALVTFIPAPLVNLGNDTTFCQGSSKLLDATSAGTSYLWSNGATSPSIIVSSPGRFWVAATNAGCTVSDTVAIQYISLPSSFLPHDTTLCEGQTIVLRPNASQSSFLWQDGSISPTHTVSTPGVYSLTITNQCGSTRDAVTVTNGICELYLPTAFTPNGDGVNDLFGIKYPGFIKAFEMQIFNRWGQCVFRTKDTSKGWNGTVNGHQQTTGNYVWRLVFTDNNGVTKYLKGNVTLIK